MWAKKYIKRLFFFVVLLDYWYWAGRLYATPVCAGDAVFSLLSIWLAFARPWVDVISI